jgi:glycosyltransferase involved in cell wall biosynthesis
MAVYNGERFLREGVESILNQSFSDFEFIIVDDGSTDSTWQTLSQYAKSDGRILASRNRENVGLTKSLNIGLRRARGGFIARQDGDDVSLPQRLTTQIAYLRKHNDIGLLGTAYYLADSQGRHTGTCRPPQTDTEIRWKMLFHNAFCHSSVVFRRELLDSGHAFYNEDLPYGQDYDLWARLLRRTSGANLPMPLVIFRIHENSIQATHRREQQDIASAISARQIYALLEQSSLPEHQVNILRLWFNRLPKQLDEQDMPLCLALVHLLSEFGKQHNSDPGVLRRLREYWIGRILAASPIWRRHLWKSGLLSAMFNEDSRSVIAHALKQTLRRVMRSIQRRNANRCFASF